MTCGFLLSLTHTHTARALTLLAAVACFRSVACATASWAQIASRPTHQQQQMQRTRRQQQMQQEQQQVQQLQAETPAEEYGTVAAQEKPHTEPEPVTEAPAPIETPVDDSAAAIDTHEQQQPQQQEVVVQEPEADAQQVQEVAEQEHVQAQPSSDNTWMQQDIVNSAPEQTTQWEPQQQQQQQQPPQPSRPKRAMKAGSNGVFVSGM